jgi:hypothetical protein
MKLNVSMGDEAFCSKEFDAFLTLELPSQNNFPKC